MAQYNRNLVAPNNINLEGYNNNKACLFCLQPVTNQTILECCGRSSHINCAHTCRESSTQRRPIFKCPNCLYHIPLNVLEINPIQSWKEDERFAAQVMAIWKDNPLWFARSHTIEMPRQRRILGTTPKCFWPLPLRHLLSGSNQKRSHSKHESLFDSTTKPNETTTLL